ncbi:unnamed protein product [Mucor hiemalis]
MNIQSLLCDTHTVVNNTKSTHERQLSWSSMYSASLPDSPLSSTSTSSSLFYSTPSSPDIGESTPPPQEVSAPIRNQRIANQAQTRTPWSSEEDQLLQQGYTQGLSWAMISTVYLPHRSRGCCWGRFKTLQSKSLEQKEWSESEDRLLLLAIKKNSRLFKQAWKSVAQDMGNRTWKECENRTMKTATGTITAHTIKKKF